MLVDIVRDLIIELEEQLKDEWCYFNWKLIYTLDVNQTEG